MAKSLDWDVIVIGGGAAGMMAAGVAAHQGKRVLVLEKNTEVGKKLAITGGGRCNILNDEPNTRELLSHFGDAAPYLFSAFSEFGVAATKEFFKHIDIDIVTEARKRAFPKSMRATDVVRELDRYLAEGRVEVMLDAPVLKINATNGSIESVQTQGYTHTAASYIFATGGVSHPETGSTGDGFTFLKELGHGVVDPTPTIVPLRVKEQWVKRLKGTTLKDAKITFFCEDRRAFSKKGDILLTHFGLSGPTILNSAGQVADLLYEGAVTAEIDLFPSTDMGILDKQLVALFDEHKNKQLNTALALMLPVQLAEEVIQLVPGLSLTEKVHSVSKEHRRVLAHRLKALPVTIEGLMGMSKAVVADGGVPLDEVDMRTMRSKKCSNVFVVGDLLHINRPTGGYSLQLCWTTGYLAGKNA